MADQDQRELRPAGRFEWEQIVLRTRWTGVIQGNTTGTRGSVSGAVFRAVTWALVSHADPDGDNIWPGDATVAALSEVGLKNVKAVKLALIRLGLIARVRAGSRRQHGADVYRLTLPSDLFDQVEVLSPAAVKLAAMRLSEADRGRRKPVDEPPPDGPDSGSVPGPPDPAQTAADPVDNADVRGPVDPAQPEPAVAQTGSTGPPEPVCAGSSGPYVRGPVDRYTSHDLATDTTSHRIADLRTDLTVVRDPPPEQDQISSDGEGDTGPPPGPCPEHGAPFAAGNRDDGRPRCAPCRGVANARRTARPSLRVIPGGAA